jgi:hypothetical protein
LPQRKTGKAEVTIDKQFASRRLMQTHFACVRRAEGPVAHARSPARAFFAEILMESEGRGFQTRRLEVLLALCLLRRSDELVPDVLDGKDKLRLAWIFL